MPDIPLVPVQDHRHPSLVVHDLPGGLLVDQLHAVDGLADDAGDGSDCCWWGKGGMLMNAVVFEGVVCKKTLYRMNSILRIAENARGGSDCC